VKIKANLANGFSPLQAFLNGIESVCHRLSLKNKIVGGYALALSIAVGGTTSGLTIGNYYQQQASASRDSANQQGRRLSDLQVAMLKTLPTREFVPLLNKPIEFEQHKSELPLRAAGIKPLIWELQSSSQTTATKDLDSKLHKCNRAAEKFYQQLEVVLNQVEPLMLQPESAGAAKKLITDFTGGREFGATASSAYELTAFIQTARAQERQAELALAKVETLRNQIIATSMVLSVLLAALLGFSTSRAIARPIEAVTQVAKLVSYSSDFTLQVPVTTSDEIGLLAISFNHLVQRIAAYTQELSQKNRQLQQATDELTTTLNTLQQTQAQLIQAEKMSSLGQMVAGVAHEINNPVGFIYGNLDHANNYVQDLLGLVHLYQQHYPNPNQAIHNQIAAIELDFLSEDLPKILDAMKIGAERIRAIVLSLRNFSRLDEAEMKPVDIHTGIDSTLLILNSQLKQGIEVFQHYGNLPLVECYPAQLNQVFMNIIVNAIDVLQTQAERPSKQIVIRTAMIEHERVQVKIKDNGPGIPPQFIGKLFDPFFTTKPVGKGTGLGLSISYQIIEKHQGRIEVNSQVNQGTEFVVTLPVVQKTGVVLR